MMTLDEFEAFAGRKAKPSEILKNQLVGFDKADVEDAERIADHLDELNLKLHGGEFNSYRVHIACGAAALRLLREKK